MSAPRAKRAIDDALALQLASGMTIAKAAELAGVCERTARRRLKEPKFRRRLEALKREVVGQAVAMLANGMATAAERLIGLVDSPDEKIALTASKAVLEIGMRFRQAEEIERKLQDLSRRINALLAADQPLASDMLADSF